MNLEFATDLEAYFDTNAHGTSATYTPYGGSSSTIKVIIEQLFYEVDTVGSVGVNSSQPMAYCRTTDVPNAAKNDTLVIGAITDLDGNTIKAETTYTVVNVQPDNTGITILVLEEQ